MKRLQLFGVICGLTYMILLGGALAQEKYPNRRIELVVPFAPGGHADILARIYSEDLARALKVPITIVNRGGGAGIEGTSYVIRAKKDGYTLLAAPGTPLVIMPNISNEVTYDPLKDLIPLGHFASVPNVFIVKSDSPFKTLGELIEYARKNPGKLKNGVGGIGTEAYFNLEILCVNNKIKVTSIPFKSGGEVLPAILGGHVDMSSSTLTTSAPLIKAGQLRCLGISSKTRHPDFPNIPTTEELGYPDVNLRVWDGIFAPAGVPQSVLNVLYPVVEKIFRDPNLVDRATKAGFTVEYKGPEEFRKFIETEYNGIAKTVKDINLKKQ